jgi:hypothetical protein
MEVAGSEEQTLLCHYVGKTVVVYIRTRGVLFMKAIKSYPTTVEAEVARIALDSAGITSLVAGVAASMEGGFSGVQLLVPDEQVEAALTVLGDA